MSSSISAIISNTLLRRSIPSSPTITRNSIILISSRNSTPSYNAALKSHVDMDPAVLAVRVGHYKEFDPAGTQPEVPPLGPVRDPPSVPPEVPPLTTSPEVEHGRVPPDVKPEIEFPEPPVLPPTEPDLPPTDPDILPPGPGIDPPRAPEFPPARPPGPEIVPPPGLPPDIEPPPRPSGPFGDVVL